MKPGMQDAPSFALCGQRSEVVSGAVLGEEERMGTFLHVFPTFWNAGRQSVLHSLSLTLG